MFSRTLTKIEQDAHNRRLAFRAKIAAKAAALPKPSPPACEAPPEPPKEPKPALSEAAKRRRGHAPIEVERVHRLVQARDHYASMVSAATRIQAMVCDLTGVTIFEMKSRRRRDWIVNARHLAMYMCREFTSMSYPDISRRFAYFDHSTVIYACDKLEAIETGEPGTGYLTVRPSDCDKLRELIRIMRGECVHWFGGKREPVVRRCANTAAVRAGLD